MPLTYNKETPLGSGTFVWTNVPKLKIEDIPFNFGAAETSENLGLSGQCHIERIFVNFPDTTNGVSATLTIYGHSGEIIFQSDALADNTTHGLCIDRIFDEMPGNLNITLSGAPGGTGVTITFSIWFYWIH